jgi:alpha-2-macroglobulin
MLKVLRSLFTLALLLAAGVALAAADVKPYARDDLASDVVRLTDTLRKETGQIGAKLKGKSVDQVRKDAATEVAKGNYKDAGGWLGAVVAADPKSFASWLALAKLGAAADDAQATGRYDLVERGQTAAYAAYQRATGAPQQAEALATLGNLFARHEMWRPALDAYHASLDRHDNEDVRSTYEDMREKHGFRILDYKVDNESSQPRICFNFSESLAHKTDFTPYVAVAGAANAAISAEDQQICVEGVKHGERYAVVLRQGLPSAVGESLLKEADYEVYVRDRSPQAHFAGRAYVLPRQGQLGAPLTTVNTAKVSIDVYRIGDRNLLAETARDDFLKPITAARASEIESQDGLKVWSGTMDVASTLNQDVVTDFPIAKAVGKLDPGVYLVTARPWKGAKAPAAASDDDQDAQLATQWMVVSDLGLTTFSGDDGIHVLARSLATAQPLSGVEMRLIAHNNEVLASKTTGADGRIDFDPGLSRGTGGSAPGLLVATVGDDYGFLNLVQPAFDLTDRGVSGRDAPSALDAFVYTERGVYRSGETVFVAALLRDAISEAKSGLPLTLVVKRPDGVEYKRLTVADQGLGGRAVAVPLLSDAAAGKWTIDAYADPKGASIGHAEFLLEDYVPERLDFALKTGKSAATPGEPIDVSLDARFLYGAPAVGLDVTGAIRLEAVADSALAGFPGYVAGLTDDEFTAIENQFPDKTQTDDKGHVDLSVDLPDGGAAKPLQAKIIVDVAESGGRTVERVTTLPVRAKGAMIGVKKDFGDDLGQGDTATFEAIAVAPDGTTTARKAVSWSLYQVNEDYQWFNSDGRWSYEPVKSSKRLAAGSLDIDPQAPAKFTAPVAWGRHRLDLKSADGEQTSITFDVGWSGTAGPDTPDNVVVTLDKASYAPGDQAKLRVASHFAGKATIALVGGKLEKFIDVDLVDGDNVVPFDVGADWGPGAYAVALTHRPLDVKAKRMPGRALGLAWFSIDEAAHKLDVAIHAPDKTRPREPLTVPIQIGGLAPGEEAEIAVAAVDVGILNLTGYKTPDPRSYFFGQRKLAVDIRDLYGMLIDGMQGEAGALQTGGDSSGSLQGNLPTQPPLALFSGVVKVGADGAARVAFDLPAFNGSVRVMAIAWSKSKVGSAEANVIVRDPVVVTATLPRFLDLGDRSQVHVDLDNVEGDAGDYRLDLDIHGPLTADADALSRTVKLAAHQRSSFVVPISAAGVGVATIDLKLTGPGMSLTQRFPLGVSAGAPDVYRRVIKPLAAGDSATIADDLVADFVPGTGSVSIAASPFGALDTPALLQALDRYPYGCSEQVVSRAMPLLYLNQIAALEHLSGDGDVDARINQAIDREMTRQSSNGAFGLWTADADSDDLWLDAFVTDFLTRAREKSFAVPQGSFDLALDHLRNSVINAADPGEGAGEPLAYALYVLARNGRPVIGDLRYLADTKQDVFKTPLAKVQLAAALAMLGDRARAGKAFVVALDALDAEQDNGLSRPDYGSTLRDAAATLALVVEAEMTPAELPGDPIGRVGAVLERARAARSSTSTQENDWMVIAAEALARQKALSQFTVDGQPVEGAINRKWSGFALGQKLITIANVGKATAQLVTTASGVPIAHDPAASEGYELERTFYKLDGTKTDLKTIAQNERVVVVLKITESEARYAKLLVVDRLPAGLEIDNPTLFDSGSIDAFSWLKKDIDPVHSEYRDDRFVAAFDREPGQSAFFSVAYVVRAVAPGQYVYPPATAEDMYRPDRFGRTAFSAIEVTAK